MIGLFSTVSKVFKVSRQYDKVTIDNVASKLSYRVTTTLMLIATIVVCAQQYIGDAINCVQSGDIPQNVLDTYCFYFGTFTLKEKSNNSLPMHLHVGPIELNSTAIRLNSYYQWVPFYLFFLAMTYYSGHFMWKLWEGGLLKTILEGVHLIPFAVTDVRIGDIPSSQERQSKVEQLTVYVHERVKYGLNSKWVAILVLSEIYTMGHSLLAYWLTDVFLGGDGVFFYLRRDNITQLFPTLSKCSFNKYGASGSIQHHDALCLLALNNVNGKIFYLLHFWMPLVCAISILAVLWRIICFCGYRSLGFNRLVNSRQHHRGKLQLQERRMVLSSMGYSDWIFMCYLGGNIEPGVFQDLISSLANRMQSGNLNVILQQYNKKSIIQPGAPPYTAFVSDTSQL